MSLMVYVFILLLIFFGYSIDGTVLNCTVRPAILQKVPDLIAGTIAIANSSNVEIFWDHVEFKQGAQFPLNFIVVITNYKVIPDRYTLQLHIYKLPRTEYDLPLWSADTIKDLVRSEEANIVEFHAFSDHKPVGPCILGIILDFYSNYISVVDNQLIIQVGSMPLITLKIPNLNLPIAFLVTDIPESISRNSTMVSILLSNPMKISPYVARETAVFNNQLDYTVILLRLSEERSMNLTVTLSANMFTSMSLFSLAAIYKIYRYNYLVFEQSYIIDTLEFPFITPNTLIPITTYGNYTIEATIYGPVNGYPGSMTLYQGVTNIRLISGANNNVNISMLYTGPKMGTTIIGTIHQTSSNLNTWPLTGSNLAFALDDQDTNLAESNQFIIFDQKFPIEFTMLNIQSITASSQNVVFTVTITYVDGTVIWEATTNNNRIIFNQLNRLDINLIIADGYVCRSPGQGWCQSSTSTSIANLTCCSQYKCANGQCKYA